MKLSGDRIKELTLDLVGIRSVVGTAEETKVSERIHEMLSHLPYYKEYPEHLFFVDNVSDPLGRKSLMAMMKGRKDGNDKAVVLIGHIDTVGTSDYGALEEYATEPLTLMRKLSELNLPANVREDLSSGNYLFGRGALDMKSGVSVIINLLETASKDPDSFSGNLVAAFVTDEEGNSKGMLSCVPEHVVEKINLSVGLSDEYMGETAVPPVTLRFKDLKPEYSVQTNRDTSVYFNFSTHISTPDVVLEKLKKVAEDSFDEVIRKLNLEYLSFTRKMNLPHKALPWKTSVHTYDKVFDEVKRLVPDLQKILDDEAARIMNEGISDEREISLHLVKKLHTLWREKDPLIILYFSPPYYPHMAVTGKTPEENKLLEILDDLAVERDVHPIKARKFYPYISDLSYFSLPEEESVESLKRNMPGFGTSYILPLDEIRELDLPVTNIGPYGFDAHQYTERIEIDYSFYTLPDLVLQTVMGMLKNEKNI